MDRNRGKKDEDRLLERFLAREEPSERAELRRRLESDNDFRRVLMDLLEMKSDDSAGWDVVMPAARELARGIIDSVAKGDLRTTGVITYDSSLLPLPQGVRSAGVDTRRLKVDLGEGGLSLTLYPVTPKSYRVMGQLHNIVRMAELTALVRAGGKSLKARCNEGGVFILDKVPAGKCEIHLRRGQRLVSKFTISI